jgi:excisionase family DNA binding protein
MTVTQAAERLEVSQATVYALVASGRLRCNRIGMGRGCIRVSDEQLADYLRGSESVNVPPIPVRQPKLKHIKMG